MPVGLAPGELKHILYIRLPTSHLLRSVQSRRTGRKDYKPSIKGICVAGICDETDESKEALTANGGAGPHHQTWLCLIQLNRVFRDKSTASTLPLRKIRLYLMLTLGIIGGSTTMPTV